jgi:Sec-independent protein translocase protein TatA
MEEEEEEEEVVVVVVVVEAHMPAVLRLIGGGVREAREETEETRADAFSSPGLRWSC